MAPAHRFGTIGEGRLLRVSRRCISEVRNFRWTGIVVSKSRRFRSPSVAIRGTWNVPEIDSSTGLVQFGDEYSVDQERSEQIKRFRAGLGPGQGSHLFRRNLAEAFTTPWLIQPIVGAGTQSGLNGAPSRTAPSGVSDVAEGTLGAYPRQ
jgi:hypothetical protein